MSSTLPSARRIHPLVATAAISVTALSLAGIGAVTGLIRSPLAGPGPVSLQASLPAVSAPTSGPLVATAPLPVTTPQVVTEPVATPAPAVMSAASSTPVAAASATAAAPAAPRPRPASTGTAAAAARKPEVRQSSVGAQPAEERPRLAAAPVVDPNQATVLSIERVEDAAEGSGVGAVGGGVLGGVLGNQVGKGNGRKAMTVLGAIGGAVAGNAIEKTVKSSAHYDVRVRLGDGSTRVLRYEQPPQFQAGDRIRLDESRAS